MAKRFLASRRSRRKRPTLCPQQRNDRRRAQVCGDCTPYPFSVTAIEGQDVVTAERLDGNGWPPDLGIDDVEVLIEGTPATVNGVNMGSPTDIEITFTETLSSAEIVRVTIAGSGEYCPASTQVATIAE